VSTPSSDSDASPTPSALPRDLRDRWQFRVAAIVVVLLAAGLLSRGCASSGREVSQEKAVQLALAAADFKPERHQIRFLQRGIPAHPFWGVSLYDVGENGAPTKVELFLVDATTGEVTRQR
jgi:hypothetical protein